MSFVSTPATDREQTEEPHHVNRDADGNVTGHVYTSRSRNSEGSNDSIVPET